MRVRPFFWCLLAFACSTALVIALVVSITRLIPMQVSVMRITSAGPNATLVHLRLTDSEGMPINEAQIVSNADMPNMPMGPQSIKTQLLGQGIYLMSIHFSMAGSWKIDMAAHADGFETKQRSIVLLVL